MNFEKSTQPPSGEKDAILIAQLRAEIEMLNRSVQQTTQWETLKKFGIEPYSVKANDTVEQLVQEREAEIQHLEQASHSPRKNDSVSKEDARIAQIHAELDTLNEAVHQGIERDTLKKLDVSVSAGTRTHDFIEAEANKRLDELRHLEKPDVLADSVAEDEERYRVHHIKASEPGSATKENIEALEQFHGLNFESPRGHVALPEGTHFAQFDKVPFHATGHKDPNRKGFEKGFEYNINQKALKGVLLEVDGGQLFRGDDLQSRFFVVCKVQNIHLPFYISSAGTGGKRQDEWYPFFGTAGSGWIIKGAIDEKTGDMFYHEEISRIQGVLNSNLKFPAQFVDLNGTITSAKDGGTLFDLKKYLKYKRVEDSEKITGYHPNPQIIFDNTSPEGSEWRKEIIASIKTDGTEQQPLPATTVAQEEINTEQIILATGHYSARPPVSGEMHQEPESAPQKPFEGPEEENGEVKFNSVEQKPDSVTSTEANVQAKEQIDSRAEARETIEKLYQWTEEVVQTWSIHGLTQGKAFEEKISSRFNNSKRLGNRLAVDVGLRGVAECIQETHDYWTRLLPRLGNKVNDNQLLNLAHTMQDVIKKRPQNAAVQSLFAQQYVKNAFNNADILERASDQLLAIAEASYDPNLGSVGTDSLKRTKDTSEYSGDGLERRLQQEASAFEQQLETTASQERAMKDALRAVHEHLDDFARELSSRYNQNMEPFMDYSDLSRLKRGLEILEAAGGSSKPIATQELEDALSDIARAFASVENTQQGKYEDGESLRKLARRIEDAEAPLRTLRTAAENSLPDSDAAITINKIIRDSESVANYLSRVRRAYEEIVN